MHLLTRLYSNYYHYLESIRVVDWGQVETDEMENGSGKAEIQKSSSEFDALPFTHAQSA